MPKSIATAKKQRTTVRTGAAGKDPAKIMMYHGDDNTGDGSARPRRATRSVRLRVFGWIAAAVAVLLVVASLAAYLKFRSVWDSIHRVPVTDLGRQPPKFTNAMNVLLIGSDTRSGANKRFGAGITGQRSDTIIILHIAPDGHGVVVLSIPRDSVVPVLACPAEAGSPGQPAQPGQVEQINGTFAAGGPGCLWKTIEQTTHLHLDHFIELNFVGFEKVIDDIGGVSICLPFAISDPQSNLHLSKGRHHVYGREALAFWRARYIGEGSDLQRIRRDQYLMASILQGVERRGLTSSPSRILSVITDAARSMTTDAGLSLPTMVTIVDSLRSLRPGAVQFIELPTVAYRAESGLGELARQRRRPCSPPSPTTAPSALRREQQGRRSGQLPRPAPQAHGRHGHSGHVSPGEAVGPAGRAPGTGGPAAPGVLARRTSSSRTPASPGARTSATTVRPSPVPAAAPERCRLAAVPP